MNEIQRLEFADSILWTSSRNALTALATQHFLNRQFYGLPEDERRKLFKTNVANNYLYQANEAVIGRSIVDAVENLRAENKRQALPLGAEDLEELRKHRVVISHPANIKFSNPDVQKFYDNDGHYKDPTAVRIWRIRQSLLNELTKIGSQQESKFPNQVTVQLGTCELIYGAIAVSINDCEPKPNFVELQKSVFDYFKKFEDVIKKSAYTPTLSPK
ncbi:MAG: hypothetical protein K1X29_08200 [Bdellovibrionales bacterium]|nr:hypothetical protein [Bdellovibrionales bacterium]